MVELNFSTGDRVRFRLAQEELDATVLDSPDAALVLVKLSSGYNIGIPKENILSYRILESFKDSKPVYALPTTRENPKLALIITGGTIASKASQATGGVQPITDAGEFLHFYPELLSLATIERIEIPFKIFSENMSSEHWIQLAHTIHPLLSDPTIEGIIVSHGTDTLHYTAAALSFFLRDLNKPVVLTYSQRSIDRASSDAHLNLICAARMALSGCAEVMIVGHATESDDYCSALRGTTVRKLHASRRDAFKSINSEPIAKVWPDRVEFIGAYRSRHTGQVTLDAVYTDKVALIKYYPGQDPSILDFYALQYKGVIIEGTGFGHVAGSASSQSWIPALKKHIRSGLVVCMTTQTIYGETDPYVYATGREILDTGVIYLGTMLSETALVKLGWVLAHYGWKKHVSKKMLENISGELPVRLPYQS